MPSLVNTLFLFRVIFPVWLFDACAELMGVSASMDHFQGRAATQNK